MISTNRYFIQINDNPIRYREMKKKKDAHRIHELDTFTLLWKYCVYDGMQYGFTGPYVLVKEDPHPELKMTVLPEELMARLNVLVEQFGFPKPTLNLTPKKKSNYRYFQRISEKPFRHREMNEQTDSQRIHELNTFVLLGRLCFYGGMEYTFYGHEITVYPTKHSDHVPRKYKAELYALVQQFGFPKFSRWEKFKRWLLRK